MTRFRLEIREGERHTTGYGVAYYDYLWCVRICYPIPINFIIGWARSFYFLLVRGPRSKLDRLLSEHIQAGKERFKNSYDFRRELSESFKQGYRRALDDLEERVSKHD